MTPRRFKKLRAILDRRQTSLTVLLDNVHKPHNFSAILRTCDAVGAFEAHAVVPPGHLRPSRHASSGSAKWVRMRLHRTHDEAFRHLKARGFRLLAAHPTATAVDFREIDYTRPTAIVLGAEKDGLSPQAATRADACIAVPMLGMVASLNVSVAAALILFEAQRQRTDAGLYQQVQLDPGTYHATLFEWAYPRLAQYCRRKGIAYPRLGPEGDLLDPIPH